MESRIMMQRITIWSRKNWNKNENCFSLGQSWYLVCPFLRLPVPGLSVQKLCLAVWQHFVESYQHHLRWKPNIMFMKNNTCSIYSTLDLHFRPSTKTRIQWALALWHQEWCQVAIWGYKSTISEPTLQRYFNVLRFIRTFGNVWFTLLEDNNLPISKRQNSCVDKMHSACTTGY